MPKFLYLAKRAEKQKNQKNRKFKFPKPLSHAVFFCAVIVSVVSYLVQANSIATRGYQIKELEQKATELKQLSRELEAESLRLQSTANVNERVSRLNMEVAEPIEYIQDEEEKVAAR